MYCSQCSTELRLSDKFCPNCAQPTGGILQATPIPDEVTEQPMIRQPMSAAALVGIIIATVLLTLLIGMIAIMAFNSFQNEESVVAVSNANSKLASRPAVTEKTPEPLPVIIQTPIEKIRKLLVNETFPVKARKMHTIEFTVENPGIVTGGFRAFGGGDDIKAFLVDETNYPFILNGLDAQAFYESGKVPRGKLNVKLTPGKYYLVFSNAHALMTDKTVAAEIYFQEF